MTDDERRKIEEIFDAVVDLPEPERSAAAEIACDGDLSLLAEGRALLAAHALADEFFPDPQPSLEGHRLGPYRVIREGGRGGMGVVYQAECADGQLERTVAI